FAPNNKKLNARDKKNYAKMRKAIFFMMLKAESEAIKRNPEYNMDDRIMLDKIDHQNGTITMEDGAVFEFDDFKQDFSINKLTDAENDILDHLSDVFSTSEKLQKHIAFLMKYGSIYKICNGNLLYHGCVLFNEDGTYAEQTLRTGTFSGKEYFDECERIVRRAYTNFFKNKLDEHDLDFCWYLWCGKMSPLFGRDKIATFERVYLPKEYGVEKKNPCYEFTKKKEFCEKILNDFGVVGEHTHIINGHVPVKQKDGENPIKAEGKLIVIDGGFCRAYQTTTGIAGYTLIYNSYGLRLSAHEPFGSRDEAIKKCIDIHSNVIVFETTSKRLTVGDTDAGKELQKKIDDLQALLESGLL
ncbi:MAG: fructose-1,6-bisphosphatase, partial [Clostridia bacterium]|nr:fructose-1,6-bisphosphatase [Clostridia bacterium]